MFSSPFIPSMSAIAAAVTAAGSVVLKVDIRAKQAPRGKRENESKEEKNEGRKGRVRGRHDRRKKRKRRAEKKGQPASTGMRGALKTVIAITNTRRTAD
jgi:hypothetical protein